MRAIPAAAEVAAHRVWLGVSLGLLMMMWLPALIAFAVDFTWTAHLLALIPLAGLTAGCFFCVTLRR